MFGPALMHFAPPRTLAPWLWGMGLLVVGAVVGLKLAPRVQGWRSARAAPRLKAPRAELDRWANEGGAVTAPPPPVKSVT